MSLTGRENGGSHAPRMSVQVCALDRAVEQPGLFVRFGGAHRGGARGVQRDDAERLALGGGAHEDGLCRLRRLHVALSSASAK